MSYTFPLSYEVGKTKSVAMQFSVIPTGLIKQVLRPNKPQLQNGVLDCHALKYEEHVWAIASQSTSTTVF
jgi:hypothetical protein